MNRVAAIALCLFLTAVHWVAPLSANAHILRIADNSFVSLETLLSDLGDVSLIFMGELHDNPGHHRAQLQIIRLLHEKGIPVAIGLEMFRNDSQKTLDQWVAGVITIDEFMPVYRDNWSMWEPYQDIFHYARKNKIPMVGLNISRSITGKVAREGFASLSPEEIGEIPGIRCNVDEKYRQYIKWVLGGHARNDQSFLNFCEAQLLWDAVMAKNLLDYLAKNPRRVIVVLAGSGHAWKYGIPEQVRKRMQEIPLRVLLPEIKGRVEAGDVTIEEADYFMMGLEQAPLH